MYAFFKENTTLNIVNLGLKIGDVVTVICVGAGGGGGGGGSTTYYNANYSGYGIGGANAGFIFNNKKNEYSGIGYGAGGAGGNGGRGGGTINNGAGGGGGGAGEVVIKTIVLNAQIIPITIGERGTGGGVVPGTNGNGINGTNGGTSSFGSYVTSHGGLGGEGGGGSSAAVRGNVGAGGWSYCKNGYNLNNPGRGSNGGNERNASNTSEQIVGGRGGGGFLPFLVGNPRNGSGVTVQDIFTVFSPFTKEITKIDLTIESVCNTYLGGRNGTNNFGRGLVMLLWD
jgi:hypothetical protein